MDPKNTMVGPQSQSNSDKPTTDKRKPVRRDPEKRRQQNIQAQKKYREYPLLIMSPYALQEEHVSFTTNDDF